MRPIVLGTRNSALALAQTRLVESAIRDAFPELAVEVREIVTVGDQRLDLSLAEAAGKLDKGLFTKELEEALLTRSIDAAVHSLKDLPTTLPAGLTLAAVLPRANVADWLISKEPGGFSALPTGALVATSSTRRQFQLKAHRPDLQIVEVRGNVRTRLNKLVAHPGWTATVLAAAGVERLGLVHDASIDCEGEMLYVSNLTPEITLPAAGQGAIAIEVRKNDPDHQLVLAAINHQPTWDAVSLERELLRALGGGCQMPLGVRSYLEDGRWTLDAVLFQDGKETSGSGYLIPTLAAQLLA